MPVSAIAGTTQTQTSQPASTSPTSNTALDRQAFLKLLVAQLKYQDPSKPMDASAMISQSAQLSVVDKLAEISTSLTNSGITDRLMLAGSVIGKQVTFPGTDGVATSATVNSVRFVSGSMVLSAGEWDVPISAVSAISPAPITPAAVAPATVAPAAVAPATVAPAAVAPATVTAAAATEPPITEPPISDPAITEPATQETQP